MNFYTAIERGFVARAQNSARLFSVQKGVRGMNDIVATRKGLEGWIRGTDFTLVSD
jgi:hypothetical protein